MAEHTIKWNDKAIAFIKDHIRNFDRVYFRSSEGTLKKVRKLLNYKGYRKLPRQNQFYRPFGNERVFFVKESWSRSIDDNELLIIIEDEAKRTIDEEGEPEKPIDQHDDLYFNVDVRTNI